MEIFRGRASPRARQEPRLRSSAVDPARIDTGRTLRASADRPDARTAAIRRQCHAVRRAAHRDMLCAASPLTYFVAPNRRHTFTSRSLRSPSMPRQDERSTRRRMPNQLAMRSTQAMSRSTKCVHSRWSNASNSGRYRLRNGARAYACRTLAICLRAHDVRRSISTSRIRGNPSPRCRTGTVNQSGPFCVLMRFRLRQPCLSYWTSS